ncbi:hypothetical protein ACP70R_037238 [Stipagrostis hirtigluma subsp. patula]
MEVLVGALDLLRRRADAAGPRASAAAEELPSVGGVRWADELPTGLVGLGAAATDGGQWRRQHMEVRPARPPLRTACAVSISPACSFFVPGGGSQRTWHEEVSNAGGSPSFA